MAAHPAKSTPGFGSSLTYGHFAPLWGLLACVLFYLALPHFPYQRELLVRYCTSHPLEYLTVGLFSVGMAILLAQLVRLQQERAILQKLQQVISGPLSNHPELDLRQLSEQLSGYERHALPGRRLQQAVEYHQDLGSSAGLEEHLRHFSELEAERAYQQFGLVNTISWAVPILGFLGTVMGITLAIANVTPDQLDQSLPEVTGGLAVAFDTTALSLSLSLVLVFATFLVRRQQEALLSDVDQQFDHRLCRLLKKNTIGPLVSQHAEMSAQLVEASAQVVAEATLVWRKTLQGLENSFANSLQTEQLRVAEVLQFGLSQNLEAHQTDLQQMRQAEANRQLQLTASLQAAMEHWQKSLDVVSQRLQEQSQELTSHSALLVSVIDKQQELQKLETQIHESLDAHQIATTLDQTLNSLTATIQLLSSRVPASGRAA